jgi:Rrf2 family protein
MGPVAPDGGVARRRSSGGNAVINISARVDYGVRVLCALAASDDPMTSEQLAASQDLPHKYLESILTDLRRGGLLVSKRGADGGYRLARPAASITLADVVGPLVGTIAEVRGERPERTTYAGPAEHLRSVWFVMRDRLEAVLDQITIDRIVSGDLPGAPEPGTAVAVAWSGAPGNVAAAPAV